MISLQVLPDLFKLCVHPDIAGSQVKLDPTCVTFTRWLVDVLAKSWGNILSDVDSIRLSDVDDIVTWCFHCNGILIVKSTYKAMTSNEAGCYHKKIWKGKIPSEIKVFLWLILNNAILTKDNLLKRNWSGSPTCYFCDCAENIQHLFFQCSTARSVWAIVAHAIGARNIPRSFNQCWNWCETWLPAGTLGIAAICWAI